MEKNDNQPMSEELQITGLDHLLDDEINDDVNSDNQDTKDDSNGFEENKDNDSLMQSLLKSYGIEDPSKLKFEDDNGEITEVDFESLDKSEQLTIIKELSAPKFSKEDQDIIDLAKSKNLSISQMMEDFAKSKIEEYANANPLEKTYSVDDFSNDELYIANLKSQFGDNFTQEELLAKLELAKTNEEVYNKEVELLRNYYKKQEDDIKEKEAQEILANQEQFKNSIIGAISELKEISLDHEDKESDSFEIDKSEKDQLTKYLMDLDSDGMSSFGKDLQNPNNLVKMAYFMLHGESLISDVSKYWKDVIKKDRSTRNSRQKPKVNVEKNDSNKTDNDPASHLNKLYGRMLDN